MGDTPTDSINAESADADINESSMLKYVEIDSWTENNACLGQAMNRGHQEISKINVTGEKSNIGTGLDIGQIPIITVGASDIEDDEVYILNANALDESIGSEPEIEEIGYSSDSVHEDMNVAEGNRELAVPGISFIQKRLKMDVCNLCSCSVYPKDIPKHCKADNHCLRLLERNNIELFKDWKPGKNSREYFYQMARTFEKTPSSSQKINSENTCVANKPKIFIVGNPSYHPYIKKLSTNSQVEVKLNSCITMDAVKNEFTDMQVYDHPEAIWLLFFGLECIVDVKPCFQCDMKLCNTPLHQLQGAREVRQGNIEAVIWDIIRRLKVLQEDLCALLGGNSRVVIMPLAPIDITTEMDNDHDELHIKSRSPFYVADDQISNLSEIVCHFRKNSLCFFKWVIKKGFADLISHYNDATSIFNEQESIKLDSYIVAVEACIQFLSFAFEPRLKIMPEKSLDSNSKLNEPVIQFGRFKHVLFVGVEDLPQLSGFHRSNRISVVPSSFPISWRTVECAISQVKHDISNILVIIVYDVRALMTKKESRGCTSYCYRQTPLATAQQRLDENVNMLYANGIRYFNSLSNVMIAPFLPRFAVHLHSGKKKMLQTFRDPKYKNVNPVFIDRLYKNAVHKIRKFHSKFVEKFAHPISSCVWRSRLKPMHFGDSDDKTHLWRDYIQEWIYLYGNENAQNIPEIFSTEAHKDIIRKDKQLAGTVNVVGQNKRKLIQLEYDVMGNIAKKPRLELPNVKAPDASLNCADFLRSLAVPICFSDVALQLADEPYNHCYIIGSPRVIDNLKSFMFGQLPVTFIGHEFSELPQSNVNTLKAKMTPLKEKSVCIVLYDLIFFTSKSQRYCSCRPRECNNSLTILNVEQNADNSEKFARTRIASASLFLQRYSKYVPCFPAPLPPHCVACNFLRIDCHSKLHCISQKGFLAMTKMEIWTKYWNFIMDQWNFLMLTYYKKKHIISDVIEFTRTAKEYLYISPEDPLSISEDNQAWTMYKDVLIHLINWTRTEASKTDVTSDEQIVEVKVCKVPEPVTPKFITTFICKLNAACTPSINPDGSIVAMVPLNTAKLIEYKLHNMRIAHSKMKALCATYKDHKSKHVDRSYETVNVIFAEMFVAWKAVVGDAISKAAVTPGLDLATFKTQLCDGRCDNPNSCIRNHGTWDRRRNPFCYSYVATMCTLEEKGSCLNGMKCTYSHNVYEQKYHPLKYQRNPCDRQKDTGKRCETDFCEFYHKDTPEVLFTPAWENLMMFGLANTVKFLGAAVKSLGKLKQSDIAFTKILVISPSLPFLEMTKTSLKPIFDSYKKSCSFVSKNYIRDNADRSDVLLGTPELYHSVAHGIGERISKVELIIVDDFEGMTKNRAMMQYLFVFLKQIKNFLDLAYVNFVVTSEDYSGKVAGIASRIFSTQLRVVVPEGMQAPLSFRSVVGRERKELVPKHRLTSKRSRDRTNRKNVIEPIQKSGANSSRQNVPAPNPIHENVYWEGAESARSSHQHFRPQEATMNLPAEVSAPNITPELTGDFIKYGGNSTASGGSSRRVESTPHRGAPVVNHPWTGPTQSVTDRKRNTDPGCNDRRPDFRPQTESYPLPNHLQIPVNQPPEANIAVDDRSIIHSSLLVLENFSMNVKYLGGDLHRLIANATRLQADKTSLLDYLNDKPNIELIKGAVNVISASHANVVSETMTSLYDKVLKHAIDLLKVIGRYTEDGDRRDKFTNGRYVDSSTHEDRHSKYPSTDRRQQEDLHFGGGFTEGHNERRHSTDRHTERRHSRERRDDGHHSRERRDDPHHSRERRDDPHHSRDLRDEGRFYEDRHDERQHSANSYENPTLQGTEILDAEKIAKATIGLEASYIMEVIRTTLRYYGQDNPPPEQINKLFYEVCSLQFRMTASQ